MAYNLRNINVLDRKPSTGVGVALPFNNPSVFKTVYTTKEQIKYNILNFLLTDTGERIFNPTFGAGLRARLFEQITDESADNLKASIQNSVENYFPFIEIKQLSVIPNTDENFIRVQFSYRLLANNDEDSILIDLQNG